MANDIVGYGGGLDADHPVSHLNCCTELLNQILDWNPVFRALKMRFIEPDVRNLPILP